MSELDARSKKQSNLSSAKQALFEKWMRGEVAANTIPRRSQQSPAPVSFAQQRLWFLNQLEGDQSSYNEPKALHIKGSLDVAALQQSLNEIVRRHEVLRTTFDVIDGQPVQVIAPSLKLTIPVIDLQNLPSDEKEAEVRRLAIASSKQPFDLAQDPLLRVSLLQLDAAEYVLLLTVHHIVYDQWTKGILIQELAVLYKAFSQGQPSPLPELPIQYADFAVWQRQWLHGKDLDAQLSYWKQQLQNAPAVLNLPTDHPRPAVWSNRGATQYRVMPKSLTEALQALSQQEEATLFTILLAALNTLLYRYTGQEDILVGSTISGRNRAELEGLIGFFVNTQVMRSHLSGNPSFRTLLRRVREVVLKAYAHQDVPFEKLVDELKLERDLGRNPLFQVAFVLQNATNQSLELPGLTLSSLEIHTGTAKFDLTLYMEDSEQGLIAALEYSTELFNAATIGRMLEHFQTLLEGIVADPDRSLSDLPLLTESERQQLLVEWNDTQTDYPHDRCIHELFEAQVELTPDAVAVVFEDQQLTYKELNARANQLAHYLQQLGVGPEVLVGICMERSLEMVVGLLGILKAGGAYVPLDPAYPQERLTLMLSDSQVSVLLTQQALVDVLPDTRAHVVCLDTGWETIARKSEENPNSGVTAENLAYVIYTSGSTGKPKGVQIAHQSLTNFLTAMSQQLGLTNQDILLSVTTISFDIAALELYLPLILGVQLVLTRRAEATDGTQLLEKLVKSGATVMQATPATWRLLLAAGWEGTKHLKILCGGEALPKALANQLLEKGGCLWNLYGPTETTIWSAMCQVEANHRVVGSQNTPESIGRPIANTQIYILDRHLQPVPIGVPGELHIGGDGLARGYLNRPELTAEKFIHNPFSNKPGARLYKTGDLARYLPNGAIEFLGRIDHQVKVRGFRIELGEIEAVLNQHPAVQASVVVVWDDESGDCRLVAYGVPHPEQDITVEQVRGFLKQKLPDYMVPSAFVLLDALPLTPNGKVDRRALPPLPERLRPELSMGYVMPRTEMEQAVTDIWQDILDIEQVGVYDNFFDLGGHSLLATQLISRYRQAFQVELSLNLVFESPTVADQALAIEQSQPTEENNSIAAIASRCPEGAIAFGGAPWAIARRDCGHAEQLATLDQALDQEVDSLLQQLLAQEDIHS